MKKFSLTVALLIALGMGPNALAQGPAGAPPVGSPTLEQMAEAAKNCPALNGSLPRGAKKGPAFGTPQSRQAAKAEKEMRKIAKALERNKQSADVLISAAVRAGVEPHVIDDLTQLSQAFREIFMAVVPPQQIVEGFLATPQAEQSGLIITAPDGSQWLVTPRAGADMPPRPKGPRPAPGVGKGPMPGMTPPPGKGPGPVPGLLPRPEVLQDPSLRTPPPANPEARQPDAAPGSVILYNETLPYWPTKDHLGKHGILKYLEKYQDAH